MPASYPVGSWGEPPADVSQAQVQLAQGLDALVPGKVLDRNVLIASWNIRVLARTNSSWTNTPSSSPKRNPADIWAIAEILSRFDVIAVQEVRDALQALRAIMACLGPDWGFMVTDVTRGPAGNHERLTFLYDLRRIQPSGLAGEIVLAPEDLERLRIGEQFARTPYIASFTTAGNPLTLATVHVVWGDDPDRRAQEAAALAQLLKLTVHDPSPSTPDDFRRNLIALGDFNISQTGDVVYRALVDHGLTPDPELAGLPRTVGETPGHTTAYDQMAWIARGNEGALGFDRVAAGTVAWPQLIELDPAHGDPTYRISDHYPLWVEFAVPQR